MTVSRGPPGRPSALLGWWRRRPPLGFGAKVSIAIALGLSFAVLWTSLSPTSSSQQISTERSFFADIVDPPPVSHNHTSGGGHRKPHPTSSRSHKKRHSPSGSHRPNATASPDAAAAKADHTEPAPRTEQEPEENQPEPEPESEEEQEKEGNCPCPRTMGTTRGRRLRRRRRRHRILALQCQERPPLYPLRGFRWGWKPEAPRAELPEVPGDVPGVNGTWDLSRFEMGGTVDRDTLIDVAHRRQWCKFLHPQMPHLSSLQPEHIGLFLDSGVTFLPGM